MMPRTRISRPPSSYRSLLVLLLYTTMLCHLAWCFRCRGPLSWMAHHSRSGLRRSMGPPWHFQYVQHVQLSSTGRRKAAAAVGGAGGGTRKRGKDSSTTSSDSEVGVVLGAPFATHQDFCSALYALVGDPLECENGRIVIARGNPEAKLMVIGEAPGETEDIQGKPFVGRAGQLLDKILESVDFDVHRDCYISNIVRRRPPNNRNPLASEVAYYKPWLLEEVRLVDPHIILLAGSYSMKALLEDEKLGITKVRGQWYEKVVPGSEGQGGIDGKGTRLLMPIFHPSYLLRNPSRVVGGPKSLTWEDIQEVRRKYNELSS